jgi:MoxR-like ATPase
MEEGKVTVDGITRELPKPYIVIATQNPIGSIGTHMLPESQLDRFAIKLSMGYPDINSEINIIKSKQSNDPMQEINAVVSAIEIIKMQDLCEKVYIDDKIYYYIAKLIEATRMHPLIKLGVSPRGTLALTAMAKATAFIRDRNYVIPDDIEFVFHNTIEHRIILSSKAKVSDISVSKVLDEIINAIPVPQLAAS